MSMKGKNFVHMMSFPCPVHLASSKQTAESVQHCQFKVIAEAFCIAGWNYGEPATVAAVKETMLRLHKPKFE